MVVNWDNPPPGFRVIVMTDGFMEPNGEDKLLVAITPTHLQISADWNERKINVRIKLEDLIQALSESQATLPQC